MKPLAKVKVPAAATKIGKAFAQKLKHEKLIMGVFDEGCMGMFNAIVPDHLLHPTGVFKERLSQSSLYAKMLTVKDDEARAVYDWLLRQGNEIQPRHRRSHRTDRGAGPPAVQDVHRRRPHRPPSSARRPSASNISRASRTSRPRPIWSTGLLNNVSRPPVFDEVTGKELYKGEALPHFNEVDECAGLDGVVTYKLWRELGYAPENTLHDLRWGRQYKDKNLDAYVWVFLISGAAPPAHYIGGYKGTKSERQPAMYFRLGGGTVTGISKPGWIVWSRVYVDKGKLKFDTGLAEVVKLPEAETNERWQLTTPQWPIMHAVLQGVSRDQMMARHKSNHIQVVYAPDKAAAKNGLFTKAAAMAELGLDVSICGTI